MIPKNIQAVIFDLDGTLVDTEKYAIKVFSDVMKTYCGIDVTPEDLTLFYGVHDLTSYKMIIEKYGLTVSAAELLKHHNAEYDRIVSEVNELLPGAENIFKRFSHLPLVICSGSTRQQIQTILSNLSIVDLFDHIVSCDDVEKHKPHPEPFLLTADKLGIDPVCCLVFEDSDAGIKAAKAAGMYVIAVKNGNSIRRKLEQADLVVDSLDQIK